MKKPLLQPLSFTLLLVVLLSGCSVSSNLNESIFYEQSLTIDDLRTIEFVHEDIYFSFQYPLVFDPPKESADLDSFPYSVEYKNGRLSDFVVEIYDTATWEEAEEEIPDTIDFSTDKYLIHIKQNWESNELFELVINSFHVEELAT